MSDVTFNFTGKRALVTGAGKGIGRAVSIALLKAGAETFALSRTKEDLDTLVKEHPTMKTILVDLEHWEETAKEVEKLGPIDLLVNNAAVVKQDPFLEVEQETIRRLFSVNFDAIVNVSQSVAKTLIKNNRPGVFVNVSSQLSLLASPNHTSTYASTKGALDQLTKYMTLELGPHRIRVNSVHPTLTTTEISRDVWENEEVVNMITKRIPVGRLAEVSDIVGPILFLLSDSASMINGAFLTIDGGYTVS